MRPGTPEPAPPGTGCDPARPNRRRPARDATRHAPTGAARHGGAAPRAARRRRARARREETATGGAHGGTGGTGAPAGYGGPAESACTAPAEGPYGRCDIVAHRPARASQAVRATAPHTPPYTRSRGDAIARERATRNPPPAAQRGADGQRTPPGPRNGRSPGDGVSRQAGRRPVEHPARTRPRAAPRVTAPRLRGPQGRRAARRCEALRGAATDMPAPGLTASGRNRPVPG